MRKRVKLNGDFLERDKTNGMKIKGMKEKGEEETPKDKTSDTGLNDR